MKICSNTGFLGSKGITTDESFEIYTDAVNIKEYKVRRLTEIKKGLLSTNETLNVPRL